MDDSEIKEKLASYEASHYYEKEKDVRDKHKAEYNDFVGQIVPQLKGEEPVYSFEPGHFTKALKSALENPNANATLVIEEINRANASALFGDIFQLLDGVNFGRSDCPIDNKTISDYLNIDKIYIPLNLYLIGAMNTSDQNVYPLDNVFKRRWDMRFVRNSIDKCVFG